MTKIKAVLFDLDNTLIDFVKLKRMCVENAVDAMIDAGLDIKKEKAIKIFFGIYGKRGYEYPFVFQEFLEKVIEGENYKILGAGISAYRKTKTAYLEPYPHVLETLTEISKKGIKLGVVTDAPKVKAWIRICSLKLHHLFDVVVTYDDTGRKKPHKMPFSKALKELKLNPSEVLMVGDWPERDIEGARRLGIKTAFARYGHLGKIRKSGADYEIDDISGILGIIP